MSESEQLKRVIELLHEEKKEILCLIKTLSTYFEKATERLNEITSKEEKA